MHINASNDHGDLSLVWQKPLSRYLSIWMMMTCYLDVKDYLFIDHIVVALRASQVRHSSRAHANLRAHLTQMTCKILVLRAVEVSNPPT